MFLEVYDTHPPFDTFFFLYRFRGNKNFWNVWRDLCFYHRRILNFFFVFFDFFPAFAFRGGSRVITFLVTYDQHYTRDSHKNETLHAYKSHQLIKQCFLLLLMREHEFFTSQNYFCSSLQIFCFPRISFHSWNLCQTVKEKRKLTSVA